MYLRSNVLIYIFLMLFACIINNILAIVLPSLRISPLLIARIVTIVLLYAAALSLSVVYIQSIGSGKGIFGDLLNSFLSLQYCNVGETIISPIMDMNMFGLMLSHQLSQGPTAHGKLGTLLRRCQRRSKPFNECFKQQIQSPMYYKQTRKWFQNQNLS